MVKQPTFLCGIIHHPRTIGRCVGQEQHASLHFEVEDKLIMRQHRAPAEIGNRCIEMTQLRSNGCQRARHKSICLYVQQTQAAELTYREHTRIITSYPKQATTILAAV